MEESIIKIKNLTLSYEKNIIVENLNVEIPRGKISILIGPNGSGKSTLLKSIARILKADKGNIIVDGLDINNTSTKILAKKLAFLPQTPTAPDGIKVIDLVSFGRFPYKKGIGSFTKEDNQIVDESLKVAGIYDLKDKNIETLSGGQRQKVWIALTLCQQTEILILDEPTTYLDLSHQLEVMSFLHDLNKKNGKTILMVIHELNLASRFGDFLIGMKKGEIVRKGTPKEVISNDSLKELFNIDAQINYENESDRPMYSFYEKFDSVK